MAGAGMQGLLSYKLQSESPVAECRAPNCQSGEKGLIA
jgi:hypothetical protein